MNTRKIKVVLSVFVAVLLVFSGVLPYCQALVPMQTTVASAATSTSSVDDYYADIDTTLTGDAFRNQLATLITYTHTKITTYDQLKSLYAKTDLDPSNKNGESNILLWYTGTSVASYSSSGANREHVWPQSLGGFATSRAGADAHHIRPCDSTLNSTRGNKSFAELDTSSAKVANQKVALGNGSTCYYDSNWFYPGEGYRGATARILMYVQTRWGAEDNLIFVDGLGGKNGLMSIGDFDTLYKWHLEEPVTEAEKLRNEAVYAIQGNRNPFIDHPEYAYMIYSEAGSYYSSSDSNSLAEAVQTLTKNNDTYNNINNEPPTSLSISGSLTVEAGKTTKLTISATPTNASKKVTWSTSDKSIATVSDDGTVTAVKEGTVTITATSTVNNVSTSVNITVTKARTVTQLKISGKLTQTEYYAGNTLDPTGLTVTAVYDDNSTESIKLSDCEWLDGTSGTVKLVEGSTSAICRYGGVDAVVNGITVKASQVGSKSVTITFSSFTGSGAYAWCDWSSGDVSGKAFIYPGNSSSQMQFNSSKTYRYLFNTTPFSGGIKSVTVKSTASKTWELRTNTTAYTNTSAPYPSTGTSQGEKTVTSSGTTWTVSGNPEYFTLNYKDSGAVYLTEIIITYGDEASNTDKVTLDKLSESLTVGSSFTLNATASGTVSWSSSDTSVATVTNGVVKAVGAGKATITAKCGNATAQCVVTVSESACNHIESDWIVDSASTCITQGVRHKECTICHKTLQTEKLSLADHTRGDWQTETAATCTAGGVECVACTVCGKTLERRQTDKLSHSFGAWIEGTAATCTEAGTVAHKDCTSCQKHFDANGNEIIDVTIKANGHSFGRWQYTDGILHRECGVCGYTEQDTNKLDVFSASVNAAVGASNSSTRFDAIAQALMVYGYLTEDEQASVETQYATLQVVIERYNDDASKLNAAHEEATQAAASIFAGSLALAALLLLLKKGLIGR